MSNPRENHPNQEHFPRSTKQAKKTKKQFFRIRGDSHTLWIHNDDDWARAYRTKAFLLCPDRDCNQRVIAKQRNGTRYLADEAAGGCSHFVPDGGGGRMTDEHLWLQGMLRDMCRGLGYSATLEWAVDGARVDLLVGSSPPYAFEVQRGSTDFRSRREDRTRNGLQTLWILPESERPKDSGKMHHGKDPLFFEPCVRLRYKDHPGPHAKTITDEKVLNSLWQGRCQADVYLSACVTVGELTPDHLGFRSTSLSLEGFIREVLEGERHWHSGKPIRPSNGGGWAGWLLSRDVQLLDNARAEADEERRLRDARLAREAEEREAKAKEQARLEAEATTRRKEQLERIANEQGEREKSYEPTNRVNVGIGENENPAQPYARMPEPMAPFPPSAPADQVGSSGSARTSPWWKRLWKWIAE